MIIKDEFYEDDLKLLKDRLLETVGRQSGFPFYALFSDIRRAMKSASGAIKVHGKCLRGYPNSPYVTFEKENRRIGCRTFSPATFAKILKAAGVKDVKKKKVAR